MSEISTRIKAIIDHYGNGRNTEFAALIGTNEGNIRGYLKGVMPKSDILASIVRNCDGISARWLLTGEGEMLATPSGNTHSSSSDAATAPLLQMLREKDDIIRQQAEEIGQLRERIIQMGENAVDVPPPADAHVG